MKSVHGYRWCIVQTEVSVVYPAMGRGCLFKYHCELVLSAYTYDSLGLNASIHEMCSLFLFNSLNLLVIKEKTELSMFKMLIVYDTTENRYGHSIHSLHFALQLLRIYVLKLCSKMV